MRRGAPSIGRPMTQFPCLVSAAPRVDAKALWIIFCGAGDAPSNDSGSPPLGLRVSDARGLKRAAARGGFDDAGLHAPHEKGKRRRRATRGRTLPWEDV